MEANLRRRFPGPSHGALVLSSGMRTGTRHMVFHGAIQFALALVVQPAVFSGSSLGGPVFERGLVGDNVEEVVAREDYGGNVVCVAAALCRSKESGIFATFDGKRNYRGNVVCVAAAVCSKEAESDF